MVGSASGEWDRKPSPSPYSISSDPYSSHLGLIAPRFLLSKSRQKERKYWKAACKSMNLKIEVQKS